MFSFQSTKKSINLQGYIRRICNGTTPNNTHASENEDGRSENRYNRTIPVLLCPWEVTEPRLEKLTTALTKDLCDRGVGLTLPHPFAADEIALGFNLGEPVMQEPWFFRAKLHRNTPLGGGFWLIGAELTEFLNDNYRYELEPLLKAAEKLRPPGQTPAPH